MEVADNFCRFNGITDTKKERLFKAVADAMKCVAPKNNAKASADTLRAIPEIEQ
jgi:hypothetical protein